jgi:hypothetical protein
MRAEMTGGINSAVTTASKDHAGRRRAGHLRLRIDAVLTDLAFWLVDIASKGLGLPVASGRFGHRGGGLVNAPTTENQKDQKKDKRTDERINHQVESHGQPPNQVENGLIIPHFDPV